MGGAKIERIQGRKGRDQIKVSQIKMAVKKFKIINPKAEEDEERESVSEQELIKSVANLGLK